MIVRLQFLPQSEQPQCRKDGARLNFSWIDRMLRCTHAIAKGIAHWPKVASRARAQIFMTCAIWLESS